MNGEYPVEELLRQWRLAGVGLRAGLPERELSAFENRHGISLPPALRTLWARADGFREGEMDATRTRYWPLGEVVTAQDALKSLNLNEEAHRGYFVFADFLLWSHGYAVRLTKHDGALSPVAIVGGAIPIVVAESVEEFLLSQVREGAKMIRP